IGTWKAQIANVKARLPEMPQLVETVQDFEALVLEGEELQSAQDVYRSKLRETTLRSKDILRRGRSFRNRLFAAAQSVFGVESPLLLELGGKPRLPKSPRRRTLDKRIADLKEQLAALEAAAEAAVYRCHQSEKNSLKRLVGPTPCGRAEATLCGLPGLLEWCFTASEARTSGTVDERDRGGRPTRHTPTIRPVRFTGPLEIICRIGAREWAQAGTNGRWGGKLPGGKAAFRSPFFSLSAASR